MSHTPQCHDWKGPKMKELVRRRKVYSVVDPSFIGDRQFAELAKLYGNETVAKRQLKEVEASEFGVGAIFATVWGDASGSPDEVGYEFVFKGERKGTFMTDQMDKLLENVIDDIVDDLEDQGYPFSRDDCRVLVFDQNGQFVPIEPEADFFAEDTMTEPVTALDVFGIAD